jgi:hypothetical protein
LKSFLIDFANRSIFGKAREQMSRMIDIHSGRMRYYFVERLNKSKDSFYKRIMEKLDSTIAGLDSAFDQGLQLRSQGEEQVERHQIKLEGELRKIDGLYQDLLDIRNSSLSAGQQNQGAVV